jgi:hypothetical protein
VRPISQLIADSGPAFGDIPIRKLEAAPKQLFAADGMRNWSQRATKLMGKEERRGVRSIFQPTFGFNGGLERSARTRFQSRMGLTTMPAH